MPPRRRLLAALAVAVVGLAACSTETPSNEELTEALVSSGLSEEVASCTADAVLDTLSDDELELLVARGAGGAPQDDPTVDDDAADRLREALDGCRALVIADEQTTTSTTTVTIPGDEPIVPSTDAVTIEPPASDGP